MRLSLEFRRYVVMLFVNTAHVFMRRNADCSEKEARLQAQAKRGSEQDYGGIKQRCSTYSHSANEVGSAYEVVYIPPITYLPIILTPKGDTFLPLLDIVWIAT